MVIYTQIRNNYWYRFKPPSYYTSYYLKILWILWLGYVLYDFSFLKILGRFILWQRIWATLVYILWVLKRICYLAVARWIILLISIRFIVEWCYWLTQYPFWFLVFSFRYEDNSNPLGLYLEWKQKNQRKYLYPFCRNKGLP